MKILDTLDLLAPLAGVVFGNHAIWIPGLDGRGVKVPFQFGGRITKRTRHEDGYPRDTIADEIAIMRALAEQGMAPPVGDVVFFRNVISDYPGSGAWHCDPLGAYGYEIADARKLKPGRFSVEAMRRLPIEGSPGAWNDISVPERENVVNGYLIDCRRSGWDMLKWRGARVEIPDGREVTSELRARVHRECQFPAGERAEAYQDFWLGGRTERGQRRVAERAVAMGFNPLAGETVLDIGCQSGGFLQYATDLGARGVGVEVSEAYVECARALARSCDQNINIRRMDVTAEHDAFLAWVRAYFPSRVDHLLLLSMEKHVDIWPLVDAIGARHTYIETNAVGKEDADASRAPMKLWPEVQRRGGKHVGDSRDRNLRRLYRIDR